MSVPFLEELKTPKGHFEINWPLQVLQVVKPVKKVWTFKIGFIFSQKNIESCFFSLPNVFVIKWIQFWKFRLFWQVWQLVKVSLFWNVLLVSSILPKNDLKILISALAYWGRNLALKNWKKQKYISKLTDF